LNKEFILYSDHEAFKHLNYQQNVNRRHAAWSEFLQAYPFLLKHKVGVQNVVADALSKRHTLLATMQMKVIGFEQSRSYTKMIQIFKSFGMPLIHNPLRTTTDMRDFCSKEKPYVYPSALYVKPLFGKPMMED